MKPVLSKIAADSETIGALLTRLVDDAKHVARAEGEYYRLLVVGRIAGLKTAAILIIVALFLVQASLTTLLIGIGFAIARLFERIGLAGGVLIAAVIGLVVSGVLVRVAIGRIAAASRTSGGPAK